MASYKIFKIVEQIKKLNVSELTELKATLEKHFGGGQGLAESLVPANPKPSPSSLSASVKIGLHDK